MVFTFIDTLHHFVLMNTKKNVVMFTLVITISASLLGDTTLNFK